MTTAFWLLNAAYAAYILSATVKEIVRLRWVLLVVSGLFIAWGIVDDVWSAVAWNLIFGLTHAYQLHLVYKARRDIDLTDEDRAFRTLLMPSLDEVSFSAFWNAGHIVSKSPGEQLLELDQEVVEVSLILDGGVDIDTGTRTIPRGRHHLIGEMAAVTGAPSSATVTVGQGGARLRTWQLSHVDEIIAKHPKVGEAWRQLVSNDLVTKVRLDDNSDS